MNTQKNVDENCKWLLIFLAIEKMMIKMFFFCSGGRWEKKQYFFKSSYFIHNFLTLSIAYIARLLGFLKWVGHLQQNTEC